MIPFCQYGETKVVLQKVLFMKINPKVDVFAIALADGEVHLHRLLSWQRIWAIPLPKEFRPTDKENLIVDMDWCPDGKLLTVLYKGYLDNSTGSTVATSVAGSMPFKYDYEEDRHIKSFFVMYDINAQSTLFFRSFAFQASCLRWTALQHFSESNELELNVLDESDDAIPIDVLNVPYIDLFDDEIQFERHVGIRPDSESDTPASTTRNKRTLLTNLFGPIYGGGLGGTKRKSVASNSIIDFESYNQLSIFPRGHLYFLLICAHHFRIEFYAYGLYRVVALELDTFMPFNTWHRLSKIWLSNDLKLVSCLMEENPEKSEDADTPVVAPTGVVYPTEKVPKLVNFQLDILGERYRELYVIIKLKAEIVARIRFLDEVLLDMYSVWEDLMAEVDSKLSNYIEQKPVTPSIDDDDDDDDHHPMRELNEALKRKTGKQPLEPSDFIDMLVFGEKSLSVEQFMTDLTEKGLKNLSQTITYSFERLHSLNIEQVQRTLMHLLIYSQRLRACMATDFQFGQLGLAPRNVDLLVQEVASMYVKSLKMQQALIDSMKKTEAFVRWLQKMMYYQFHSNDKESMDNYMEILAGTGSCLQMSQQDSILLMDFLQENAITSGFKFEAVAHFLRKSTEIPKKRPPPSAKEKNTPSTSASSEANDDRKLSSFLRRVREHFAAEQLKRKSSKTSQGSSSAVAKDLPYDPVFDRTVDDWMNDQLLNIQYDIDMIDLDVHKNYSMFDHFKTIIKRQEDLFDDGADRLTFLQHIKLTDDSILYRRDNLPPIVNCKFFDMPQPRHSFNEPLQIDYCCSNIVGQPTHHYWFSVTEDGKHMRLLHLTKAVEEDEVVQVRHGYTFKFINNCQQDCRGGNSNNKKLTECRIRSARFFHPNHITLLLDEIRDDSQAAGITRKKSQHLVQFAYKHYVGNIENESSCFEQSHMSDTEEGAEAIKDAPPMAVCIGKHLDGDDADATMCPWPRAPIDRFRPIQTPVVVRSWTMAQPDASDISLEDPDVNKDADEVYISGDRKLASLVDEGRTRIVVYEMDGEEASGDEEEEQEEEQEEDVELESASDEVEEAHEVEMSEGTDSDGFVMVNADEEEEEEEEEEEGR